MKMYTNSDQTAKLIELGFEKPKTKLPFEVANDELGYTYSIGELIEMLPNVVESEDSEYATLQMYFDLFNWIIEYTGVEKTEYATSAIELIDALYNMLVQLKVEGYGMTTETKDRPSEVKYHGDDDSRAE